MFNSFFYLLFITFFFPAPENDNGTLKIKKTADFAIDGSGANKNWNKTDWLTIPQRKFSGDTLSTKIKVLYSDSGIYFLLDCKDKKLSSTMGADFMDLWKEDVVEVFLWTDESDPAYFEYELSPSNHELPLLISNKRGDLARWQPFHYEEDRKTRHAVSIIKDGEAISGWMAEFYIPFNLLRPLHNIQPTSGTRWRANMYRVDYDNKTPSSWSWQLTKTNFHDYERFGTFLFQ